MLSSCSSDKYLELLGIFAYKEKPPEPLPITTIKLNSIYRKYNHRIDDEVQVDQ